jgi:hypothetical protein
MAGWKLAVVALAVYAVFVTYKLLDLIQDVYEFSHNGEHSDRSERLSDFPAWDQAYFSPIHTAMGILAALVGALVISEIVKRSRNRSMPGAPPPPQFPPPPQMPPPQFPSPPVGG